eukprot:gnl/TRDRNA2_/TRDRNA2_167278_c0_seq1.p1 gnl/TRDRNA2_/TRDRNA2_167278_c0~~gnl/TRDRNA2_/TRDRNA2_167278_c0_seq1.p1  ORF type:complete len:565 (-),score=116.27 gnl/TRDRNA2_/TRDRNA2_167278_c0_seq1:354-1931(-)
MPAAAPMESMSSNSNCNAINDPAVVGALMINNRPVASPMNNQRSPTNSMALTPSGGHSTSVPTKLFVGGVSAHTTTEVLRTHFSKYGRIIDAVVMSKNGRPRGFGFVTFDSEAPSDLALSEPQWLDGRLVDVKRAVPGEKTQDRSSNKIFVGGLPQGITTEDLKSYFSTYGPIADAVVMVDRRTNRSRGFGFIRFGAGHQGSNAAEAVLSDMNAHRLAGKWVEVKRATPASLLSPSNGRVMEGMYEFDAATFSAWMEEPLDGMGLYGWESEMGGDSPDMMSRTRDAGHARGRRARRRKPRNGLGELMDDESASGDGSMSLGGTPMSCTSGAGTPGSFGGGNSFFGQAAQGDGCSAVVVVPGTAAEADAASAAARAWDCGSLSPMGMSRMAANMGMSGLEEQSFTGLREIGSRHNSMGNQILGPSAGLGNFAEFENHNGSNNKFDCWGQKGLASSKWGGDENACGLGVFAPDSENNPGRANLNNDGIGPNSSPMKIEPAAVGRTLEDPFTREDFLSLEVRPWLTAP